MPDLRVIVVALDQRPRVVRLRRRGALAVRFAVLGWRLGGVRERFDDRRSEFARVFGY